MLRFGIISDHTYLPDRVGGRESSIDALARQLTDNGHDVQVLADRGSLRALPKALPSRVFWSSPYGVTRVKGVANVAATSLRKDVIDFGIYNVAASAAFVAATAAARRRQFFCIRDVGDNSLDQLRYFDDVRLIANSQFIREHIYDRVHRDSFVLLPTVNRQTVVGSHSGRYITMINPIEAKGLSMALSVAASLPQYRFLFVKCWPMLPPQSDALSRMAARLGNIDIVEPTMLVREIYERTRVLLVPSLVDEAFGRVAIEAQMNGIPVIASRRGGLPEAVGPGGTLVDPNAPSEVWTRAICTLMEDPILWHQVAQRALDHARDFERMSASRISELVTWMCGSS